MASADYSCTSTNYQHPVEHAAGFMFAFFDPAHSDTWHMHAIAQPLSGFVCLARKQRSEGGR